MATVSAWEQARRRKPTTYGKTTRTINTWNLSNFDALDDEDKVSAKAQFPKAVAVRQDRPAKNYGTKPHVPKLAKPQQKKQDAWDVPSSDEERDVASIPHRTKLYRPTAKRDVIDVPQETEARLAPWERKQTEGTQVDQKDEPIYREDEIDSAEAQLAADILRAAQKEEEGAVPVVDTPEHRTQARREKTALRASPVSEPTPKLTSAAARLQAKRLLEGGSAPINNTQSPSSTLAKIQKRSGLGDDKDSSTPRKRLRLQSPKKHDTAKVIEDVQVASIREMEAAIENRGKGEEMAIFDVPNSSADKVFKQNESANQTKPGLVKFRRGRPAAFSSARKMESAPARLRETTAMDMDEDTPRSPSTSLQKSVTPQRVASPSKGATPNTAFKTGRNLTPRQAQLWSKLLPGESSTASPSLLPMKDLTLQSRQKTRVVPEPAAASPRAMSDVGRRRTKLVDRLKQSTSNTDDASVGSDEEGSEDDFQTEVSNIVDTAQEVSHVASQQSRSQGQSQSVGLHGPKVTYAARARSYLPEDSFEDQLMLDMPGPLVVSPLPVSRFASAKSDSRSQESTFDVDSDEDDEGGRLRTVHELRAAGGNQRFMDNIGALLEDITDHNVSARSRRRSALAEITLQLRDKAFTERFIRQGYEAQLLKQCDAAPPDIIADVCLASAFTMILATETTDHVIQSFKDSNFLAWVSRLLGIRTGAGKLVKDRRNNMAKSAQASFLDFATTVAERQSIWGDVKPAMLTPRTIALKGCDQLIGKLRRLGDRSELVTPNELENMIPTQDDMMTLQEQVPVDTMLSISALESLSTTTVNLSWPPEVVERVSKVLMLALLSKSRWKHLLFLTLRLCLNLTNENKQNCRTLSKQPIVVALLRSLEEGFASVDTEMAEEERTINFDLLVLSMGILINFTEHNDEAREHATSAEAAPLLGSLVDIFQVGQQRLTEAESVEQGITNVAYGYLAVLLANLCRNGEAKGIIASKLPGRNLRALVAAVEEFVMHHQRVDTLNFEGEEGMEVWSAFTEKLKGVLEGLKAEAGKVGN